MKTLCVEFCFHLSAGGDLFLLGLLRLLSRERERERILRPPPRLIGDLLRPRYKKGDCSAPMMKINLNFYAVNEGEWLLGRLFL